MTKYAVYQYGYAVWGTGATEDAAIEDAIANGAEFDASEISNDHVYGEMVMIKITDELCDYIDINGGDVGIERGEDGIYTLA